MKTNANPPTGYITIQPGPGPYNRDCADIVRDIEGRLDPDEAITIHDDGLRERAYDAAVAKLNSIYSGQIPESVAREIADAVVDALAADRATEK
ncbi:hypothetical protein [Streptomyces prasinus]